MKQVLVDINREYEYDVVVCGGGVSGFAAAVASARSGAKTLLLESGGFLGGTATKGLVGPFMTCYDIKGEKQIIKGLFSELVENLKKEDGAIAHEKCRGGDSYSGYRTVGHIGVTPFLVETLKRVMEKMCIEAGVKLLYHTNVIGCEKEGNSIKEIYASDYTSVISIKGKVFIDTTGLMSLGKRAGAELMRGNEDGIMQTASQFFIISGVNKEVLDKHMEENTEMRARFFMDKIEKGQKDGSFPCGTQKLRIYENPDGTWTVNMAQIDEQLNELDCEEVTNAEIKQRKQIMKLIEFLKNNIKGLENIELVTTASDIGIRESSRMVGKTIFGLSDMQESKKFDDRIAVCSNSIDIHQKVGVNYVPLSGEDYYIPLSCLISKNIDNLMTAGKTMSADKYAFAAVRVMPPCIAMGEAVGVTAALAAKDDISVGEVSHKEVQKILIENGAYLG